ncbi:hypothetical protein DSM106972_025070 [Dulcicalothrix desertica PCC 7102]|uniref:Carrier domain-containing protein n=1 Tax=Dulcicalothrix desertica PCC 7102 TaxID=232991 RepID=A0A433VMB9_9CYAN|nr:acyl carrier protein [Dulcicalothrix desertica]RUT07246.1 hypothetical protein DSM106972_025070 [Dulcicalothrix desertica PCC 7102]TWH61760.1 aryl carrier-like protein [Dulcicalothrix desertica PCC 7102]
MKIQNQTTESNTNASSITTEDIQAWLVSYLAELLEISPEKIDVKVNFDRYGLDSSAAISLLSDLSVYIGCDIDPDSLYHYPTIERLTRYLGELEEITL